MSTPQSLESFVNYQINFLIYIVNGEGHIHNLYIVRRGLDNDRSLSIN